MAYIKEVVNPASPSTKFGFGASAIPYGQVDSTSTATAFTATVQGINALEDGVCVMLKNGVVTSAAGCTLDINGLGAKPIYHNMAAETAETTTYNINYTMLFVYDTTRVSDGCWVIYRGYNSNSDTIAYSIRTNEDFPTADYFRRYRLLFTNADNTKWVPANSGTDNNKTSVKIVNQRPINPFGRIAYYGATTVRDVDDLVSGSVCWEQYATNSIGYSFNGTAGATPNLTVNAPVYLKCAPQADGSAIIDSTTPYVQTLPSSADGKIYIYLGFAATTEVVQLMLVKPVYYHDGSGIRLWTGAERTIGEGYGTCGTSFDVSGARTATLAGYQLTKGYVTIKFSDDVPLNATLNINTQGAKSIYYGGSAITAHTIKAGDIVTFFYDGTNYNVTNIHHELVTSISSLSTDSQYPSAKCVYDLLGDVETLLAAI